MVYSSSSMFFMVFLSLLWPLTSGHLYNLECGPEEVPDFTIEPSEDGVLGRYLVQWCSQLANPTIEKWTFFLYTRNVSNKDCEFYKITDKQYIHSRIEQKIHKTFECPAKTCISTYLDLVYTGCYTIRSEFHLAQNQRKQDYRLRYITSGLSSLDDINSMKSAFVTESLGENIMLKIDSRIPLTDYYVKLCRDEECSYIEESCSVSRAPGQQLWSARCVTSPPAPSPAPAPGPALTTNYTGGEPPSGTGDASPVQLAALLSHVSPWTHGVMFRPDLKDVYFNFSYSRLSASVPASATPGSSAVSVGACAALVLAACALAAAARATRRWRGPNMHHAQHRYNTMPDALPAKLPVAPSSDVILLVYVRDVSPFMQAADCLADTIQRNHIGRVVSMYSPRTASSCGGSGAEWLRDLLCGGARVLVLQTPALLHATTQHAVVPLGSGVGSSPFGSQFGDSLVSVALRCLQTAHVAATAYRTYYVANVSPSPCEVVPLVSPYRRYELPEALPTLLDHLAPGGVTNTESMVQAMQHMSEYLEFVRNNPHYLKDLANH